MKASETKKGKEVLGWSRIALGILAYLFVTILIDDTKPHKTNKISSFLLQFQFHELERIWEYKPEYFTCCSFKDSICT